MARAAVRRRLSWQLADVVANRRESARAHRLTLDVPDWGGHLPGQHVDVRLTAEDGYRAQRSYSVASPPEQRYVDLIVERLPDGEVSPYLTDEVRPGDRLELRGPIGGYFVWHRDTNDAGSTNAGSTNSDANHGDGNGGSSVSAPVQLIAGGSGVVPFLAMIAHHEHTADRVPMRLLYSARTADDLIGADLLRTAAGVDVTITLTGATPPEWAGRTGRIGRTLLLQEAFPADRQARVYVCGPTSLVELVAATMLELGHDAMRIRTERFGATGGRA